MSLQRRGVGGAPGGVEWDDNGAGWGDATPTTTVALNHFDDLVAALEERVLVELERRGGRYREGWR